MRHITYKTESEYLLAVSKLTEYDKAAKEYMTANKVNSIHTSVQALFPFSDEVSNEMRSAIEVYEFINNPPDKYILYIDDDKMIATTWTGQKLGTVSYGKHYKDNMGGQRCPINIKGINGENYYGTYYKSSGNYARIKKRKYK